MAVAVERGPPSLDAAPQAVGQPPKLSPFDFAFKDFLRREYKFGLDSDRGFCKAFREGHCPLGNNCPDKHQPPQSFNSLVCKHWLRGLCKKGDQCEFLHEYNLSAKSSFCLCVVLC